MADAVTRAEFDELRSDVGEIKSTLNNHVLSTLKAHGERLDDIEVRLGGLEDGQRGLQDELHLVKDGVDAIRKHLGV